MRILSQVRDELAAMVAAAHPQVEIVPISTSAPPAPGTHGDVLLTYPWAGPNLAAVLDCGVRWVHVIGTGVDAFPLHLLTDQTLTCSRGGSAVPIAEWVLAMMLAFEKRLPDSWIQRPPATRWGLGALGTLHRKVLGLVGFGSIAQAVAQRALPFGMRIRAVRRSPAAAEQPEVEIVTDLRDLVATADHLIIAAAATTATRHMINDDVFAVMKRGTHLVNVARGALVDHDALRGALDDGRVAMASLDAVDPEPLPEGHWLYTHPRVRLSPHVSWSMPGAAERLVQTFIDNVHRHRAGEPLLGVVDREAGY
jgi:phosphoglycerate dehydrogenase-like enzyme